MTRLFVALSVVVLVLVGIAAYKDSTDRQYIAIQQQYIKDYPSSTFDTQVQQLFPAFAAAERGDTFRVERCISCHVPDVSTIGPQLAAKRLAQDFQKYEPNAKQIAQTNHLTLVHPAVVDSKLYAQYGQDTTATVDGFHSYQVVEQATGQQATGALPGFIPSFLNPANNGNQAMGIDQTGCIVCHNGSRLALDETAAHQNLIINPEYSWSEGAALYYTYCATCHGALGQGGVGPPLNNQDRLGYFNEDYYYRCIEYGFTDYEHYGSVMPDWGSIAPDFQYDPTRDKQKPTGQRTLSEDQINILVQFIRHWENYNTLP